MKRTSKSISIVLLVCILFVLPCNGLSVTDAGIVDTSTYQQYVSLETMKENPNVKNYNSNTVVVLEFSLTFIGGMWSTTNDQFLLALNNEVTISEIIKLGDGLWYDSLVVTNVTSEESPVTPYKWVSIYGADGSYRESSNRLRTVVYFTLTYTQPSGVPSLLLVNEDEDIYNILTKQTTNFNIELPWYNGNPFSCYFLVHSVTMSAPLAQRKYIPGGDGTYDVYFCNTYMQPFALGVYKANNITSGTAAPPYESTTYYFDVVGENLPFYSSNPYLMDGELMNGKKPYFGLSQFQSIDTEFSLNSVSMDPRTVYINGKPAYIELRASKDGSSFTQIQNVYNPFAFCYTSFRYKDTVTITNDTNNTSNYDVSNLYMDISFNIPQWGEGDNFGQNLGLFFVGMLEALLSLVGSAAYNMIVWIACETPLLSNVTKPLFMLGVRAGGIFSKFFLPVITALGFFTPVVCVILLINVIKKYAGV